MPKKKVLMMIGGMYHPWEPCAEIFKSFVEASGRYVVEVTQDRSALKASHLRRFDAVAVYAQGGKLTKEQESGLTGFVRDGGAFVGLHSATAAWKENDTYIEMIGGVFAGHGPVMGFPIHITDSDHLITQRIRDFRVMDELYLLDKFDPQQVHLLATTQWRGKTVPMAYTKTFGKGRVYYLAPGHDERTFNQLEFQKMALRGLDWTLGRKVREPLKAGVVGYGGAFNMGKRHIEWYRDGAGFIPTAVCDSDSARRKSAEEDFPGIETYSSVTQMLKKSPVEVVTIITPHNSHARLAVQIANAKRHVVCEKPLSITVQEADGLLKAAESNGVMLSVFHNRRWDGTFMCLQDIVTSGLIGEVFQVENTMSNYEHPKYWWRSHKPISGGAFYDMGAHVVDWVLNLIPEPIREISGHFQQNVAWFDVTNEDHCLAVIRFESGKCAIVEQSKAAAASKPTWRVLGSRGAVEGPFDGNFRLTTFQDGVRHVTEMPIPERDWEAYYRLLGDHLMLGEPLPVTAESARRVIAVLETAEKSSKMKKAFSPPKHCK